MTWDGVTITSPRNAAVYVNVFEEDAAPSQCVQPKNPDRASWMTARGLTFRNVVATGMGSAYAGCFNCAPNEPCQDISFDNVKIDTTKPYKCFNTRATSSGSSPSPC